jgi:hypothetical protein
MPLQRARNACGNCFRACARKLRLDENRGKVDLRQRRDWQSRKRNDAGNGEPRREKRTCALLANGKPSVLVIIFPEPGANIILTVERVKAELPMKLSMPEDNDIGLAADRTTTIRASLQDTEVTLVHCNRRGASHQPVAYAVHNADRISLPR